MNVIVGGNYRVIKKIAATNFSSLYLGENMKTKEKCCLKLESVHTDYPQLAFEYEFLRYLNENVGIPKFYYFGTEADYRLLAVQYFENSLQNLFEKCKYKFSLKTVLMLADQLLLRIEFVHKCSFVHRDVKPENFMFGDDNIVYSIDYGFFKSYISLVTKTHVQFSKNKMFTGTTRYASINALKGYEQSRRDDLESLAYVLIYFMKGHLPWIGVSNQKENLEIKESTSPESLCSHIPQEFCTFLKEVRALKFSEEPKYGEYRELFRNLFIKEQFLYDYQYDWSTSENQSVASETMNTITFADPVTQISQGRKYDKTSTKDPKSIPVLNNPRLNPELKKKNMNA